MKRSLLIILLGLLVSGLLPSSAWACFVSKSCTYGSGISCSGTYCSAGPEGWGWVECDNQRQYCQAPLCDPVQCTIGPHCVGYCTEQYPNQSWFPICHQGCCDCALGER